MKRSKKWLLILCAILLLPLPVYLLWQNCNLWQKYLQLKLPSIGTLNPIFTWYLIAISAIMLVILIISLLILLFWPVQSSFHLIPKQSGQVKVTNKAVNGFVLSSLKDLPYLNNAKVDSKLTKNHIKISVSGDLGAGENVANLLEDYLQKIKVDLKQLLGIEQKPKIRIKFTNYHDGEKPEKRVQ
ncbi:alkaline shock response membrane anchor protein AmaP [Lactobacillus sp. ESL0731]|uniref:alkaline shock response membrane anchor protein AmaP n=1 Tax=unclassified Lactobacillus TaxID=2620435 RepID=UPI0023F7C9D9|nr:MULTISPECIES: alkaline shock response membrane anchor protein AmaP [unclassified Lactobacillus]WEV51125.1 alkaline shock response membrane anchor protein AmaP [Lactobacillus sp. ESL0700]WEV62254.1 alkaline shock response membrane anchor protein AmaP [Lactobacillus sp. ESL0731]